MFLAESMSRKENEAFSTILYYTILYDTIYTILYYTSIINNLPGISVVDSARGQSDVALSRAACL